MIIQNLLRLVLKLMTKTDPKSNRSKIAINENTYHTLKNFSRLHGLKLRILIDAMTDSILGDETLSKTVINKALEQQSSES